MLIGLATWEAIPEVAVNCEAETVMRIPKPEWEGTDQHRGAKDLSRYLVHLTRSEDDLISILRSGRIEARNAFGVGRNFSVAHRWHYSVCLTEIPLQDLRRMTKKRPWGIAFDKERLRTKFDAQPVWYLRDPSTQLEAVHGAMRSASGTAKADIWSLTPFIESVRSFGSIAPNDWRHEREWRVTGDLEFEFNDIALLVLDDGGKPEFLDDIPIGIPVTTPGDLTVRWSGGYSRTWDDAMDGMLDRFQENFVPVEQSGAVWDQEEARWFSMVEVLDEESAMDEIFGDLREDVRESIVRHLADSAGWCRTYDLDHASD